MSEVGLGCVKTRRRSIAIEEIIRPRPLLVAQLASEFNLEVELKNIILVAFRFFEFLHSQGHYRKWRLRLCSLPC
jgi:hypothetical protein